MSGYSPLSFAKVVTTAGTRVALSADKLLSASLVVEALPTNTGNIYVGGIDVSSSNGIILQPGQSVSIPGPEIHGNQYEIDLAQVYLDAGTNGDATRVMYLIKVT